MKGEDARLKYFFSGASGIRAELLPVVAEHMEYRLLSMHDSFKSNTRTWTALSHHPKSAMREIMLDSGAYTAWSKGHPVKLESLIAIYEDTISKIKPGIQIWLINLDVIPGAPGVVATAKQVEEAIAEGDKNFKILRERFGDRVLPVYHQREGIARLREVMTQADYIGAGFRQDESEENRVRYAEEILAVTHEGGKRVHGLATTGYKMLKRTNFDSVDSASMLYAAAMGKVLYIDPEGDLDVIPVSEQSPLQSIPRQHYKSLTSAEQRWILKCIEESGCTLEQVANDLSYRIVMCTVQLATWLKAYRYVKPVVEQGLFPL